MAAAIGVAAVARLHMKKPLDSGDLPPLPRWNSGGFLVDIADRDALYRAMEEDVCAGAATLGASNQITLPAAIVETMRMKEGDSLRVVTDGNRMVVTLQKSREPDRTERAHERKQTHKLSDLFGAASGLYGSADEIDAEIAKSRGE